MSTTPDNFSITLKAEMKRVVRCRRMHDMTDHEVTKAFGDLLLALMASRPRELAVRNTTAALHERIASVEVLSAHFRTFMRALLQDTQHNLSCSSDVASEFVGRLEDMTSDAVGALLKGIEDTPRRVA